MENLPKEEIQQIESELVLSCITDAPHWTDDKIANFIGVQKAFVANIRKELASEANGAAI